MLVVELELSAMKAPALISHGSRPPLWREARIGLEAAALAKDPVLRGHGLPDGRGRPALLIPGFMAGDSSLALMANWLRRSGFRPQKAEMRANVGCAGAGLPGLEERLEQIVAEQGKRAVVIGQSRGGGQAKVLAARRPDLVCGIVTLGSPHVEPLAVHPVVRLGVEAVSRLGSLGTPGLFKRDCLEGDCCASFWKSLAAPLAPQVGFVAVYSRSDGIVDWRACLDPDADEHVEIGASHCGMAVSPAAWRAVAEALERFAHSEAHRRKPVQRLRRVA
jgi:pimeloyl-ACP methyl ester carboxylesterase